MNLINHRWPGLIAGVVLCTLAGAAGAVYKWVDEDGNVHYSQTPPNDRPATEIELPESSASDAALKRLEHDQKRAEQMREQRLKAAEEQLAAKKEEEDRKKKCAWARGNLTELQTSNRIYQTDASGARSRVPEEQRQERIKRAQEQIEEFCN
jgi:hypothetical protein